MRPVLTFLLCFLAAHMVFAQEEFTFTDSRDGTSYRAIEFSIPLEGGVSVSRSWMGENLNYEMEGAFCYKDEPAYCGKFGKLYTYAAALEACPEGWRIPTRDDWYMLFSAFGGTEQAATALKEDGESTMNLYLGGFGDASGIFKGVGIEGNYWDSEQISGNTAGVITIRNNNPGMFHSKIGKNHRNSSRCIKDY